MGKNLIQAKNLEAKEIDLFKGYTDNALIKPFGPGTGHINNSTSVM